MTADRRTHSLGVPGARGRGRASSGIRAARSCPPTTRCSTTRSATSSCATSRAPRTWPTATRARPAGSASPSPPRAPAPPTWSRASPRRCWTPRPSSASRARSGSRLIGSDAFQETDITGITLPITKHNYLVTRAEDVAQAIREAFYIARSGRPGPGAGGHHEGRPAGPAASSSGRTTPKLPGYRPDLRAHPREIQHALDLIHAAKRPLILAGQGIIASGAMRPGPRVRRARRHPDRDDAAGPRRRSRRRTR